MHIENNSADPVKRRRGRPPGRKYTHAILLKHDVAFGLALDDWREGQADRPNRTEAVRRLVRIGLGRAP